MIITARPLHGAALALALASACVSPARESPPPAPRPPASSTPAPPTPARAAPRTTGVPVVLAHRRPTAITGMEWAWLLPEARLVTLLPEDAAGHRTVGAPLFIAGPRDALITVDLTTGAFLLGADGGKHGLGQWHNGGFDGEGRSALVWDNNEWALFSRSGERVMGEQMSSGAALLLPSGLVLQRRKVWTKLVRPPGPILTLEALQCDDVFARAGRLLCFEPRAAGGPMISVFSLETGERIARTLDSEGLRGNTGTAVRGDGGALAFVRDEAKIVELRHGVPTLQPRVIARDLPRYASQRVAFTADGSMLCVESADRARILKTAAPGGAVSPPKGRVLLCLFTERTPVPVQSGNLPARPEWEGWVIDAPAHEGFEPIARYPSASSGDEVIAASADRKIVTYLEQKKTKSERGTLWSGQLVVLDAATRTERRVIAVGEKLIEGGVFFGPKIELSADGGLVRVCSASLGPPDCRVYDTSTGKVTETTFDPQRGPNQSSVHFGSGAVPDARVADVAALLPRAPTKAPTLAAWHDDGPYLSVEVDLGGGATQRFNLKDSPQRSVQEATLVGTGAGRLLTVAEEGSVALWSLSPIEMRAVLIPIEHWGSGPRQARPELKAPVEKGTVALFPDGTYEAIGDVEGAVRCQRGEEIVPVAECGELRAPAGTLAALVKEASR